MKIMPKIIQQPILSNINHTHIFDEDLIKRFLSDLVEIEPEKAFQLIGLSYSNEELSDYLFDTGDCKPSSFSVQSFKKWLVDKPVIGEMWFNSSLGKMMIFDNNRIWTVI